MKERESRGFEVYRLIPLIEEAVMTDGNSNGTRIENRRARNETLQKVWGGKAEEAIYFRPSVASICLRWEGFENLGYPRSPETFPKKMNMVFGSAAHEKILRILGRYGVTSQPVLDEELMYRGELDFLFKNPRTQEFQILDFKFVQNFAFNQVEKNGPTYIPSPEARLQVLLYMVEKRKEGFNVEMGNIIYINRDNWKMKECFIPWDAKAEYEVDEFAKKVKEAREKISKGEFPESSVISSYACASFCPYRTGCDSGRKFAAEKEKKQKVRKPAWVYKQAREKAQEREKQAEDLGISQAKLL